MLRRVDLAAVQPLSASGFDRALLAYYAFIRSLVLPLLYVWVRTASLVGNVGERP
jgi:hypothetical protein